MEMKSSGGGGMSVLTVVGIVFIILKLVGLIDWPWIWVLAPFWIAFAIGLAIAAFFIVLYIFMFSKR